MLSTFPHLTICEFDAACVALRQRFEARRNTQHDWTTVEIIHEYDSNFLRITKALDTKPTPPNTDSKSDLQGLVDGNGESDVDEVEELDSEVFPPSSPTPLIHYDIILSPIYLVPTLYIHISDPLHRYPPAMSVLNAHLIPPEYRAQTDRVGVMGGVTIGDHPVAGRPVFYIHPCQTAAVMEVIGSRGMDGDVTGEEYLLMWIGALGGCVGLDIPLSLATEDEKVQPNG